MAMNPSGKVIVKLSNCFQELRILVTDPSDHVRARSPLEEPVARVTTLPSTDSRATPTSFASSRTWRSEFSLAKVTSDAIMIDAVGWKLRIPSFSLAYRDLHEGAPDEEAQIRAFE